MGLRDSAKASGPRCLDYSESLSILTQGFRVGVTESGSFIVAISRWIPSGDQCNMNIGGTRKHLDRQELKIISLTLEKLLQNLPRLGGYTQWVRPGAHPVLDLQQRRTFLMSTEGLRSSAMRFNSALGGLTEVDLCTSLPSGVPESRRLPCSVTRLPLLGVQDSAMHRRDPQRIRMRGSN